MPRAKRLRRARHFAVLAAPLLWTHALYAQTPQITRPAAPARHAPVTAARPSASASTRPPNLSRYNCRQPYTGTLTYPVLRALIEHCERRGRVRSLDDLMPLLPEIYRTNLTLAYDSQSPEAPSVDPMHPRVIMYGPDARLVLAVTGNPNHPDYHKMQVLEYLEGGTFRMHEIHFNPSAGAAAATTTTTTVGSTTPTTPAAAHPSGPTRIHFDENPQVCAQCHGTDRRPIWNPVFLWPGFYGSNGDALRARGPNDPELRNYTAFRTSVENSPRYRSLQLGPADHYNTRVHIEQGHQPNLIITQHFFNLNARRIARIIQESPNYPTHRFHVMKTLLACVESTPNSSVNTALRAHRDAYIADLIQRHHTLNVLPEAATRVTNNAVVERIDNATLVAERLAQAINPLQLETTHLFTTFDRTQSTFSHATDTGGNKYHHILALLLLDDLTQHVPSLRPIFNEISAIQASPDSRPDFIESSRNRNQTERLQQHRPTICQAIAEAEAAQAARAPTAALTATTPDSTSERSIVRETTPTPAHSGDCPPNTRATAVTPPSTTQTIAAVANNAAAETCAECHFRHNDGTDSSPTPPIPFNDAAALAQYLRAHPEILQAINQRLSPTAARPMPPGSTSTERNELRPALENYLRQLTE